MKYLQSITGKTKGLKNEIKIPLKGRNLIITGQNGVGKTFFLNEVNNTISKELLSKIASLSEESYKAKISFIKILENLLDYHPELNNIIYDHLKILIKLSKNKNEFNKKNINLFFTESEKTIYEISKFIKLNVSKIFFEANYSKDTLVDHLLNNKDYSIYHTISDKNLDKNIRAKEKNLINSLEMMKSIMNNFDIFTTIGGELKVKIENIDELSRDIRTTKITFNYFSAFRQTQITHSTNTCSLDDYIDSAKSGYDTNLSQAFEQYLVNIKIEKSLALTERYDTEFAKKIDTWFDKLVDDLKFIFEDDSTLLSFDSITKKVLIEQDNKSFDFQSLSSGYSSIFTIYTELMMRSQLLNILPDELSGIVLIDEIDAHLHISLQRKIFPFLIKSFPNIQFIVTTHSPFVITSSNSDTVIFDLTDGSFIEENLSTYSVESITKELFHVNTESIDLKKSIDFIYNLIKDNTTNYKELNSVLKKLQPYKSKLNSESKSIYLRGLNYLIDRNELGDFDV